MLKAKSDIHHSVCTSDRYSAELEIQWQSLAQLPQPVRLFVHDPQGRFAASYSSDNHIRLYDMRALCVCMTVLSAPEGLFESDADAACVQLCFSACAHFLLASFAVKAKKRKFDDSSSVLVLWHIPSQRIVQKLRLPSLVNVLFAAPSRSVREPCFAALCSLSPSLFLVDCCAGRGTALSFPHTQQELHQGLGQQQQSFSFTPLNINAPTDTQTDTPTQVCGLPSFASSPSLCASPSAQSEHVLYCALRRCDANNALALRELVIVRASVVEQHTLLSLCEVSVCDGALCARERHRDTLKVINTRATALYANSAADRVLLCAQDRVLVFSLNTHTQPDTNTQPVSLSTQTVCVERETAREPQDGSAATHALPLSLYAEYCGLHRNTRVTAASWLTSECVLLCTAQQVDRLAPIAELVLWPCDRVRRVHCGSNSNSSALSHTQTKAVPVLRSALLAAEWILSSPRDTLSLTHSRPPHILALDHDRRVWSSTNLLFNSFPGPMYPAGYTLVEQVRAYVEREDELDIVPADNSTQTEMNSLTEDPLAMDDLQDDLVAQGYLSRLPLTISQLVQSLKSKTVRPGILRLFQGATTTLDQTSQRDVESDSGSEREPDEEEEVVFQGRGKRRKLFPLPCLPAPSRVKTGDFYSKIERDRAAGLHIQQSAADQLLLLDRLRSMKSEAISFEVRATLTKEKSRLRLREKKEQLESKREDVLQSMLDMAIRTTDEEARARRREVHAALRRMVLLVESRVTAAQMLVGLSSASAAQKKVTNEEPAAYTANTEVAQAVADCVKCASPSQEEVAVEVSSSSSENASEEKEIVDSRQETMEVTETSS